MSEAVKLRYDVDGDDYIAAGSASSSVKKMLKQLGYPAGAVKRVAICMYEGEINMVIHADGGEARVDIVSDHVDIVLEDRGPGIADIALAMQEGYSTASEHARSLGFGAGMGLPNMKRYADAFAIESTVGVGTTVRMRISATEGAKG